MDSTTTTLWTSLFLRAECLLSFYYYSFTEVLVFNAKSVDPDQNANHSATSMKTVLFFNIGIKHGFSCNNIRQVPWEVLKTEAEGRGFQHLPRDLANVNALKNHF